MRRGSIFRVIPTGSPGRLAWITLSAAILSGVSGCSEPAQCQAPTDLAFDNASAMTDVNAAAPGVQSDIHLTSSLAAGELVELEIADAAGNPLATMSAAADADGNVTFSGVSMPPPQVVLRATADATCGIGRAELAIDVSGGSACQLSLAPAPETNAYYAPMGVLSSLSDPDAATPGYQTTVEVATLPGWTAELFETAGAGGVGNDLPADVSIGMLTAAADGVATQAVTVVDGERGFYAICRGPGTSELTSPSTTVIADTTPPACGLTAPLAPSTITRRYDTGTAAGWQLALAAHAEGDDVAGEPVALLVGKQGTPPTAAALPAAGATGDAASTITIAPGGPGSWDFALTMRDHAGNLCTATQTFDVEPDGCDLTVTSPTDVTIDADRNPANGSQVAVAIQIAAPKNVTTACTQQLVSVTCGIDQPSTFTDTHGRTVLRPTICSSAPCTTEHVCVVEGRGTRPDGSVIHTRTAIRVTFDDAP